MTEFAERRVHNISMVDVRKMSPSNWGVATANTNSNRLVIQSRAIDRYMNHESPPIKRQDFMDRAKGWVREEDIDKLYLLDFREALGRLVSILLHRGETAPEELLKEKGLL